VFHVKHEGWTPEQLSTDQLATLDAFERLLQDRAIPRGMIASSDREHVRSRHILDSLRAVPFIGEGAAAVDLGSGAGLPGLPIAVVRPDVVMTLSEPRQARSAFLELVVERLGLPNVRVSAAPAEELTPGFAACLARGFGDMSRSWAVAREVLHPDGELIYWAGKTYRPEDLPEGVRIRAIGDATLERGGPIVIMTRQ
jgi:16S rRNA (guanine527-N7)-methyltransferase